MICAGSFVLAPATSKFKQQKHTKSSTFVGCWSLRFICFFHKFDDKLINDRLKNLFNNNVSSSVGNVSRQYFIMFCMLAAFNFYHSFIECFFSCIFFVFWASDNIWNRCRLLGVFTGVVVVVGILRHALLHFSTKSYHLCASMLPISLNAAERMGFST